MEKTLQKAYLDFKKGDYASAWESCQKIIQVNANQPDCLAMLGMMSNIAKRYSYAESYLQRCLIYHPHKHVILTELATAQIYLQKYKQAEENLNKSIAFNSEYQKTYIQFGKLYKHTDRIAEAKKVLKKLLLKKPQSLAALNNLGSLLIAEGKDNEALACFQHVLKIAPNTGVAHKNAGLIWLKNGKENEAELHFAQALKSLPNDIGLMIDLSQLWLNQSKLLKAEALLSKALLLDSENVGLLMQSAITKMRLKKYEEAIVYLKKVLEVEPDNSDAFYKLSRCKTDICDWTNWNDTRDQFIERLSNDLKKINPVQCSIYDTHYYNIPDELQHKLMLKMALNYLVSTPNFKFEFSNRAHTKLRIGYISPDFRQHALGMSVYKYFQHHNRQQFEVHVFAVFMPKNTDPFTEEIKSNVDHFHDISELTSTQGANLIYDNEIDILIDFGGYTNSTKPEILVLKPAPIQIFMMGQPDTTGSNKYDFFFSDPILIDDVNRQYYTENILFHPHGFVSSLLEPSDNIFKKEDFGIDEDAFVFCSFCSPYKYEPTTFSAWMKILKAVENSVLWLLGNGNTTFEKNIYASVEKHGVDAKRVMIAPYLNISDHLNRLKLCDLFLDTLYYTSCSSGSHALMMGVPVISIRGVTNAMRQGASVCHAASTDETVCNSIDEYYSKAVELALNKSKLNHIKNKLVENQSKIPIFNTKLHVENLERSYLTIWDTYQKGKDFTDLYIDEPVDYC